MNKKEALKQYAASDKRYQDQNAPFPVLAGFDAGYDAGKEDEAVLDIRYIGINMYGRPVYRIGQLPPPNSARIKDETNSEDQNER